MSTTKPLPAAPKAPAPKPANPQAVAVAVPAVTRLRAWPKSVVPVKAPKVKVTVEAPDEPTDAAPEPEPAPPA